MIKAFSPTEKGFFFVYPAPMAKAQYAENKKKMKHPLRSAVTTTGRRTPEPGACGVPTACAKSSSAVRSSASPTRSPSWCRDTSTCEIDNMSSSASKRSDVCPRNSTHHRRRRRHRHGARRHALFAALARDHCRQRRIYGQRPQGRRTGLHPELRQNHPRNADGRHAAQHRRPSSYRAGRWRRGTSASGRST